MSYNNYQLPPQANPNMYSSAPGAYPTSAPQQPPQQQFTYNDPFAPSTPPPQQQHQQQTPPPAQYQDPNDLLGFAMPPSQPSESTQLVPHYGTAVAPPSSSMPARATTPPPPSNTDPSMAAIIASQEKAMKRAKNRSRSDDLFDYRGGNDYRPTAAPSGAQQTGTGHVHPDRMHMKQERKAKTAAGAAGGALVGGLMFGPAFPVGMVLGGAVGGYASNKASKSGERRAQRKFEQDNVQRGAAQSHGLESAAMC